MTTDAERHPDHDRLCAEVRSWYHESAPQIGIQVEHRRYGSYRRNVANPDSARIILSDVATDQVPGLLTDAREYFDDRAVEIWVDDHRTDEILRAALLAAGCSFSGATIYLAHVGAVPEVPSLAGVSVDEVNDTLVREYVAVKLKGFADSEDEPASAEVAREMAVRSAELRGAGWFSIARLGCEGVAIIGYYGGNDTLIINLATRLPFRNRGVARLLLCQVLADAQKRGCRSTIINTNPANTPIKWYRRLGFRDEVYWYNSYSYRSGSRKQ